MFCVLAAIALAGCTTDGRNSPTASAPRGATVAFDSIDGPPAKVFHRLVRDLNDEAQTRKLAVVSREGQSAYRVRGYMAAQVVKGRTSISWVWDVYDTEQRRALRITGEEAAPGKHPDAWAAADNDELLRRIARTSMEQLAAFLNSPSVAPVAEAEAVASVSPHSPEAAGILRPGRSTANPVSLPGPPIAANDPAFVMASAHH